MSLAKVFSATTVGLDPILVEVEVSIEDQGFPAFKIVGLPDKAVDESKERVRSALKNSGYNFPISRITVNLAPADLPKQGPVFDLAIALGILVADGQLVADLSQFLIIGELSLDGIVKHTNGVLALTSLAKLRGFGQLLVPLINSGEASIVKSISVYAVETLVQAVNHISGANLIFPTPVISFDTMSVGSKDIFSCDLSDVRGQEYAKRALEIAAAGGHNVLLKGPPGSGKTMLARTIPSILPPLSADESLEITKIYSITGQLPVGHALLTSRPFRSPHHTISRIGLIGGGSPPRPGEISLSHRGVLFLDEFPELPRSILESLRQPLEDGVVTISRATGTLSFPARFIMVVAANPCPCGYYGSSVKKCTCNQNQILSYQRRISGPILDRIDLHLEVPEVKVEKLTQDGHFSSESSANVQKRVTAARNRQYQRLQGTGLLCNSEMRTPHIRQFCSLEPTALRLLKEAVGNFGLSARAYFRVIKVARTISDLAGIENIGDAQVAEALQYRERI